jgi:heme oxygenase
MPLAQTLRDDTRELHTFAEKRPLQIEFVSGRTTRERLAAYLAQLAHVHAALERAIEQHADHPAVAPLTAHTSEHAPRLAADVASLDPATAFEALPGTSDLVASMHAHAATDPARVAGALYVLEGSMNGNRFIARALAKALALAPGQPGLSYFDPYGESQPARWAAFREALGSIPESATPAVVEGAEFMFRAIATVSDEVFASLGSGAGEGSQIAAHSGQ